MNSSSFSSDLSNLLSSSQRNDYLQHLLALQKAESKPNFDQTNDKSTPDQSFVRTQNCAANNFNPPLSNNAFLSNYPDVISPFYFSDTSPTFNTPQSLNTDMFPMLNNSFSPSLLTNQNNASPHSDLKTPLDAWHLILKGCNDVSKIATRWIQAENQNTPTSALELSLLWNNISQMTTCVQVIERMMEKNAPVDYRASANVLNTLASKIPKSVARAATRRRSRKNDLFYSSSYEDARAPISSPESSCNDFKSADRKRVHNDDLYCHHCYTRSTPEWRKGPDGPKTLCNACGLRYTKDFKKQRQMNKVSGRGSSPSENPNGLAPEYNANILNSLLQGSGLNIGMKPNYLLENPQGLMDHMNQGMIVSENDQQYKMLTQAILQQLTSGQLNFSDVMLPMDNQGDLMSSPFMALPPMSNQSHIVNSDDILQDIDALTRNSNCLQQKSSSSYDLKSPPPSPGSLKKQPSTDSSYDSSDSYVQ